MIKFWVYWINFGDLDFPSTPDGIRFWKMPKSEKISLWRSQNFGNVVSAFFHDNSELNDIAF